MTIELVTPFFSYGSETGRRLVNLFRNELFEEVAKSNLEGLIFTYTWSLDEQDDWDYVNNLCEIFESKGSTVYFIELEADVSERIKRNMHPHRLHHKPTKRDTEKSKNDLIDSIKKYRMNSKKGEFKKENYIKIDNTHISPEETAQMIIENFDL
jgi:hypothetical protein